MTVVEFTPYSVDKIMGEAVSMSVEKAKKTFPVAARSLESPDGPIHMLVRVDHMKDAPREQARREGLVLYRSEFRTGYVACSNMGEMKNKKKFVETTSKVLSCRSMLFHPPKFIPVEAMGTELPRRCPACRNCKECQFRMDSLSFKEITEYEIVLSKLKLDVDRKK